MAWFFGPSNAVTRVGLLKNLRLQVQAYETQILKVLRADFNKPEFETLFAEIYPVYKEIDFFIRNLKNWMKDHKVQSPCDLSWV